MAQNRNPIIRHISDLTFSPETLTLEMMRQPNIIQSQWWTVIRSYIYGMATNYEYGFHPHHTEDIAEQSYLIVDRVFGHIPRHITSGGVVSLDQYDLDG